MQAYKEELVEDKAKKQFMKIISLPTFVKTQQIVLLDLETMQSYQVSFDTSIKITPTEVYDPNADKLRYQVD